MPPFGVMFKIFSTIPSLESPFGLDRMASTPPNSKTDDDGPDAPEQEEDH